MSETEIADYRRRERVRDVTKALRWARLTPLAGADLSEAWRPLAVMPGEGRGLLTISHSHRGYWVVGGDVPLALAKRLYDDPAGRDLIRVDGHCGCPPPEDPWLKYYNADGGEVWTMECRRTIDSINDAPSIRASMEKDIVEKRTTFDDDRAKYPAFVRLYHIDGDLGLRVFVDHVRQWDENGV